MNPVLKKWLYRAGSGIGLAGFLFILIRLYQYSAQLDVQRFRASSLLQITTLALIYGGANLLLAAAWRHLLGSLGTAVSRSWANRTYGISHIAKYIPGNIFQFTGRQALGLEANLPGWVLIKSVFWELILISMTGFLLACMALPSLLPKLSIFTASFLFLFLLVVVSLCLGFLFSSSILKAFYYYLVFHLVSGLIFVGTLTLVIGKGSLEIETVILYGAAYVIAWLAGLVTFGSPAGIGVREVVLLFLLGPMVVESDLLVIIILNRIITVIGDGIFFACASFTALKKG